MKWSPHFVICFSLIGRESEQFPGTPFSLVKMVPVDMFPQTKCVELVAVFERWHAWSAICKWSCWNTHGCDPLCSHNGPVHRLWYRLPSMKHCAIARHGGEPEEEDRSDRPSEIYFTLPSAWAANKARHEVLKISALENKLLRFEVCLLFLRLRCSRNQKIGRDLMLTGVLNSHVMLVYNFPLHFHNSVLQTVWVASTMFCRAIRASERSKWDKHSNAFCPCSKQASLMSSMAPLFLSAFRI